MNKFTAAGCCHFFTLLGQRAQIASIASNPKNGEAIQEHVPQSTLDTLKIEFFVPALYFCKESELKESAKCIKRLFEDQFKHPVTNAELQWALHNFHELMTSEMKERKFFSISATHGNIFDDPYPMLKEVSDAFPKAQYDIKEAYNCLVLERHTAAVFHAMRVAEHGLRLLTKKLRVTLTHKGQPQPIDTATWDKIIGAIKSKLNHAHTLPHGARRNKQLRYYSDMADRCSYMKDLWRNPVMHTRSSYNANEAAGALQRVSRFMQLLAEGY